VGWAKNGDEVFWEEKKFHAASGKAQACTQGALLFSLLGLGGGGGIFFQNGPIKLVLAQNFGTVC